MSQRLVEQRDDRHHPRLLLLLDRCRRCARHYEVEGSACPSA